MSKLVNFQNLKVSCTESLNSYDLEDIVSDNYMQIKKNSLIPDVHKEQITNFMLDLTKIDFSPDKQFNKIYQLIFGNNKKNITKSSKNKYEEAFVRLRRIHKIHPKKSQLFYMYRIYRYKNLIKPNLLLEDLFVTKNMRSQSGVLVISVIMPPDNFSCSYNCHYCPNDPKYSRSYYRGEPTVQRGERNNFDAYKQFYDRAMSYFINGHHIDKVELIILGGTFSCYKPNDSENFIKNIFYAANTVFDDQTNLRTIKSLEEEILINEDALCKIIGITIETRPDKITKYELRRFRSYGVTRIQMGVQHTDDKILDNVNRQCNSDEVKRALKLAKDNGFKIDIHLMPDLPGATPEIDREMFTEIINNPDYQADQWKIYPTVVLEYTKIKEWYDNGTYKPYAETQFKEFLDMLVWVMLNIPPWIRVNRVQRDFPGNYIEGGNKITNLRQVLDNEIEKVSENSKDIRSMEVKYDIKNIHKARIVRVNYDASDGKEIFLSHKSCTCTFCWKYKLFQIKSFVFRLFGLNSYFYGCGYENIIYSFLRLRISSQNYDNCFAGSMTSLGKIRELHVYGNKKSTYDKNIKDGVQHCGFGKQLLYCAESISRENGCNGTCVIAGVGTRNYYRKFGYEIPYNEKNHGWFMIKLKVKGT
jgi:elongator complex protein 3